MDKKSRILTSVFFILLIASIGFAYYRIVVKKDYIVESQTDCDPEAERCFIYNCDPESESCTGDEKQDTSYYKISRRKASMIPDCDPKNESCQPFVCGEGEKDCEEIFCSENAKLKDNKDDCNDPIRYAIENPSSVEESIDGEDSPVCDATLDSACEVEASSEEGGNADFVSDSGAESL